MKPWIPGAVAVALAAALAVPVITRPARAIPTDRLTEAWNGDAPARVRALLADDAVLLGRVPVTGADAVAAWAAERMATSTELELSSLYERRFRDVAYQTGIWSLGSTAGTTTSGLHTFVWRHGPDGWRLASIYMLEDPAQ